MLDCIAGVKRVGDCSFPLFLAYFTSLPPTRLRLQRKLQHFHSRGEQPGKYIGTKESVNLRKEFNSRNFYNRLNNLRIHLLCKFTYSAFCRLMPLIWLHLSSCPLTNLAAILNKINQVIYQTRETVFHQDIQTPRRELRI